MSCGCLPRLIRPPDPGMEAGSLEPTCASASVMSIVGGALGEGIRHDVRVLMVAGRYYNRWGIGGWLRRDHSGGGMARDGIRCIMLKGLACEERPCKSPIMTFQGHGVMLCHMVVCTGPEEGTVGARSSTGRAPKPSRGMSTNVPI